MIVEQAKSGDRKRWNAFVAEMAPDHHAFYFEWSGIIERTFHHTPIYLMALSQGSIAGVLPLFRVESRLFGASLISVPYLNGGGILAKNDSAFKALLKKAHELKGDARYVEFRARAVESRYVNDKGFPLPVRTHKVAMQLEELPKTEEELLRSFDKKLRAQIKRPAKDGVTVRQGTAAEFYSVFTRNMRDLGTPVYPKQLWEEITGQLAGKYHCLVAEHGGEIIAAGFSIIFDQAMEITWASSLRKYNRLSANMLLYFEMMKRAIGDNATIFDFGRSDRDSSTFRFKAQWGAKPKTLYWYYLANLADVPQISPKSSKFRPLVAIWQRLPLWLANRLGPILTRHIP